MGSEMCIRDRSNAWNADWTLGWKPVASWWMVFQVVVPVSGGRHWIWIRWGAGSGRRSNGCWMTMRTGASRGRSRPHRRNPGEAVSGLSKLCPDVGHLRPMTAGLRMTVFVCSAGREQGSSMGSSTSPSNNRCVRRVVPCRAQVGAETDITGLRAYVNNSVFRVG